MTRKENQSVVFANQNKNLLPEDLPTHTVANAPDPAVNEGRLIYVNDGAGGTPVLAFCDGTNWLRSDTRAVIFDDPRFGYAVNGFKPDIVIDWLGGGLYLGADPALNTFDDFLVSSRASTATFTDSNGLIQTALTGVPRLENFVFQATGPTVPDGQGGFTTPGAFDGPRLLEEPDAATNQITDNNDPTGRVKSNAAVNAGFGDSPFGPNAAIQLIDDNAGGNAQVFLQTENFTVATTTEYTYWGIFKQDQLHWVALRPGGFTTPAAVESYFDLENGVVGTAAAGNTLHMFSWGDGWYLCGITFTTDAVDTTGQIRFFPADDDGDIVVARDGTSSILFSHDQFERGSVPTSAIITNGTEVTRETETIEITAAALSREILAATGSTDMPAAVSIGMVDSLMTYADEDIAAGAAAGQVNMYLWEADSSNFITGLLSTQTTRTGEPVFQQRDTGTLDAVDGANDAFAPGINVPFSIASRHGATFINGAHEGTVLTADLTPTALAALTSVPIQLASVGDVINIATVTITFLDLENAGIGELSQGFQS